MLRTFTFVQRSGPDTGRHVPVGPGGTTWEIIRRRVERAAFDRRLFLGGALAVGAGALATACGSPATVAKAAATTPAGSDLGAIEHVVFLMQENRSVDHHFGSYKGVRGFYDHPPPAAGGVRPALPGNTYRPPVGTRLPFHLDVASGLGGAHPRPLPQLAPHTCARTRAPMDSFVETHTSTVLRGARVRACSPWGTTPGPDLPSTTPWPTPSPSATATTAGHGADPSNRLMAMSGTVDPDRQERGAGAHHQLLTRRPVQRGLDHRARTAEDAGVSWKTYTRPGRSTGSTTAGSCPSPTPSSRSSPSTPIRGRPSIRRRSPRPSPTTSPTTSRTGTLPEVSWIIPPRLRRAPAVAPGPRDLVHPTRCSRP